MGKKKASRKKEDPGYEEIRERLEQVVSQLERGEGTLEEALAAYEEGVALVKSAHGILDAAEKRLELLKPQRDGTFRTEEAKGLARDAGGEAEEAGEGDDL